MGHQTSTQTAGTMCLHRGPAARATRDGDFARLHHALPGGLARRRGSRDALVLPISFRLGAARLALIHVEISGGAIADT